MLTIRTGTGSRRVRLASYLDAVSEETAAGQANAWIKSLRNARVDGVSFRERFTYSGDSLWWFAELYLHKGRSILSIFRTLAAAAALFAREAPSAIRIESGGADARLILHRLSAGRRIACEGALLPGTSMARWLALDARGTALMFAAIASPARPARRPALGGTTVAAFVHRAFWRPGVEDAGAESYIGPVLQVLERRLPERAVQYIGVGPATNFQSRRWWSPIRGERPPGRPIESLVPRPALAGSIGLWTGRHAMRRSLEASRDLREAAVVAGCDMWPVVRALLAGVALLQFPWSARAMDEAAAALDACRPAVAVTYAEAGGWGRALVLESRRRGIPLAGLQHGFIYRHWLNYLHEADEMGPPAPGSSDAGFPLPTTTLVFDAYAARHLVEAGRFPPRTVRITGSPRLDQLGERFHALGTADVAEARAAVTPREGAPIVLLVTKYAEVRAVLPALLAVFRAMPDIVLAIKAHPADALRPYADAAAGMPNVTVLPAAADLAPLLRASRALVTVNSTVALDSMALGVPALVIGLPNNLSPFVTAGALAGAGSPAEIAPALHRLLYDEEFRRQLAAAAAAVTAQYRMRPDGGAAGRQAEAILELVQPER